MIAQMRMGGLPAVATDAAGRSSPWPRRAFRYGVPALAAALLAAGSLPASAQGAPPDPEANHVWAGCQLNDEAVAAMRQSIIESSEVVVGESVQSPFGDVDDVEVAFVVVYSLQENDGQALDGGDSGFTGPILCAGGIPFGEGGLDQFSVQTTTEDALIPDPEGDAVSVDILDLEEALILRYAPNFEGSEEPGSPEKRICHTVDDNNDCFIVSEPFFEGPS